MSRPVVLVIGGGPAGLAAAIWCTLAGLETSLLTDSEPHARWLTSESPSETVHPGIEQLLTQLQVPHALQSASRGTYRGVWLNDRLEVLGSDDRGEWLGYHIERARFDGALLDRARSCGVQVVLGTATSLFASKGRVLGARTKTGEEHVATFTIDATGYRRLMGRSFDVPQNFHSEPLLAETGRVRPNETLDKRDPTFIPEACGWTWIAPEEGGACTWTSLRRRGTPGTPLPPALARATSLSRVRIANQRWRVHRHVAASGALMVGDAAGSLDPGAGQGLLFALWSGIMAAHAIRRSLEMSEFEAAYFGDYDNWFQTGYESRASRLRKRYDELNIRA